MYSAGRFVSLALAFLMTIVLNSPEALARAPGRVETMVAHVCSNHAGDSIWVVIRHGRRKLDGSYFRISGNPARVVEGGLWSPLDADYFDDPHRHPGCQTFLDFQPLNRQFRHFFSRPQSPSLRIKEEMLRGQASDIELSSESEQAPQQYRCQRVDVIPSAILPFLKK